MLVEARGLVEVSSLSARGGGGGEGGQECIQEKKPGFALIHDSIRRCDGDKDRHASK